MNPCNLIPGRGGPGIRSFGPLEIQSEEDNRVKKETMRRKLDFILRYSLDTVKFTPLKYTD